MSDNKEIFEMENSPIKETKKQKKTRKPLNEDEKQKLISRLKEGRERKRRQKLGLKDDEPDKPTVVANNATEEPKPKASSKPEKSKKPEKQHNNYDELKNEINSLKNLLIESRSPKAPQPQPTKAPQPPAPVHVPTKEPPKQKKRLVRSFY